MKRETRDGKTSMRVDKINLLARLSAMLCLATAGTSFPVPNCTLVITHKSLLLSQRKNGRPGGAGLCMLYLKHPRVPINKQAQTWSTPKRNPPSCLLAGSSKKAGSALWDIPVKDTLHFHKLFMVHKQYRMVSLYPAYRKDYAYYFWVMTRMQLGNER